MSLLVTAAPFDFEGQRQAIVMLEDTTELDGLRSLMRSETSFAGIVGARRARSIRRVASLAFKR